jgi:hypothetical protein
VDEGETCLKFWLARKKRQVSTPCRHLFLTNIGHTMTNSNQKSPLSGKPLLGCPWVRKIDNILDQIDTEKIFWVVAFLLIGEINRDNNSN